MPPPECRYRPEREPTSGVEIPLGGRVEQRQLAGKIHLLGAS